MALGKLLLRGVVSVVVVVVGVTAITWLSVNALRPDLRAGDDRFILVALVDYLQNAFLHFEFGTSFTTRREIADLIRQGLPADLSLLGGALVFGLGAGIAGGAYCAARPRTKWARLLEGLAALFLARRSTSSGWPSCCCSAPASGWSASSPTSRPPTCRSPTARCAGRARC